MIVIPNSHAEAAREGPYDARTLSGTCVGLSLALESNLAAASATLANVRSLCRPPLEVAFGMTIMKTIVSCGGPELAETAAESARSHPAKDRWLHWHATSLLPGDTSQNPGSAAASLP